MRAEEKSEREPCPSQAWRTQVTASGCSGQCGSAGLQAWGVVLLAWGSKDKVCLLLGVGGQDR